MAMKLDEAIGVLIPVTGFLEEEGVWTDRQMPEGAGSEKTAGRK